jgi:hypothetical protein
MTTTKEQILTVAEEQRKEMTFEMWPHCYDISREIADSLITDVDGITADKINLVKYNISYGSRYDHYALEIKRVDDESYILDASFDQFATETGTPVNLCSKSEIDSIVMVSPPNSYIFHKDRVLNTI